MIHGEIAAVELTLPWHPEMAWYLDLIKGHLDGHYLV